MAITDFQGKYRFLSNFHPSKIYYEGRDYRTVEHAYQAAKTTLGFEKDTIRELQKPGEAKKWGRKVTLRPDWKDVKLQVMEDLVRQKFNIPALKEKLLATADEELVEGNAWGDTFYGVCNGVGENHLGKILMKIREELRNG